MSYRVENLRIWRSGNWVKYESKPPNFSLRIQYDQLLITTDNKVMETLNFSGKLKGILKDDVLILIISLTGQEVRKFKFQIRENLAKCLEELSARIPIATYGSAVTKTNFTTQYRNIEEIIKDVIEGKVTFNPTQTLPIEFKNFVKLCLIDPEFPQILKETEKILKNKLQWID